MNFRFHVIRYLTGSNNLRYNAWQFQGLTTWQRDSYGAKIKMNENGAFIIQTVTTFS